MWQHQFYYLFGFLALVFLILIITCAEITIVLCYFQLCSEVRRGAGGRARRRPLVLPCLAGAGLGLGWAGGARAALARCAPGNAHLCCPAEAPVALRPQPAAS